MIGVNMKLLDLIETEKNLKALIYGNANDPDAIRALQMKAIKSMVNLEMEIIKHSQVEVPIE